jgi:TRAP-type C4-dicarboxylate transport system substrate-binding protein
VVAGDVYTSLERGVVEGFGFPVLGPRDSGWTEVTEYIIDEPYLVQNGTILVNPETFNSLPSDVQEAMKKATADFEPEMQAYFEDQAGKEWKTIRESGGVEPVEFSPEDSEKFLNLWVDEYWATMEKKVPNEVEQLKELLPPEELKNKFSTMENQ